MIIKDILESGLIDDDDLIVIIQTGLFRMSRGNWYQDQILDLSEELVQAITTVDLDTGRCWVIFRRG